MTVHPWIALVLNALAVSFLEFATLAGNRLAPIFRDGDMLIVSPSARAEPGDRVVVRLKGGEILVQQLASRTSRRVSLKPLASERTVVKRPDEIVSLCRILWASQ